MMTPENSPVLLCAGMIFVAVFGACVKWLNARKENPVTVAILGVDAFTAAFIGLLFYYACRGGALPVHISHILAGVGGFYGTKTIDFVSKYIMKWAGGTLDKKEVSVEDLDTQELRTEYMRRTSVIEPVEQPRVDSE